MVFPWNSLALANCSSLSFENPSGKIMIEPNSDEVWLKMVYL